MILNPDGHILNPKGGNRDNYRVRFERLVKELGAANKETFQQLANTIEKQLA